MPLIVHMIIMSYTGIAYHAAAPRFQSIECEEHYPGVYCTRYVYALTAYGPVA